jgi:hypothetical protein
LVEHATENRSVGGSIPPLGTISTIRNSEHPAPSMPADFDGKTDAEVIPVPGNRFEKRAGPICL